MSHRRIPRPAVTGRVRLPVRGVLAALAVLAGGCAVSAGPAANAATRRVMAFPRSEWPGARVGNGKFNHNSIVVDSPSFSHDIQHIRNVNVGGNTVSPAALCRHVRRCKIIQRLHTFDP